MNKESCGREGGGGEEEREREIVMDTINRLTVGGTTGADCSRVGGGGEGVGLLKRSSMYSESST